MDALEGEKISLEVREFKLVLMSTESSSDFRTFRSMLVQNF